MNNIILELVEKNKKNSRLSSVDRETFENKLLEELTKGIYTNDLEVVLCEGPVNSTMKVLAMYFTSIEISGATSFFEQYINSTRVQENKGGTSGIRLVWLFTALVECSKDNNIIIERVFSSLVWFAYKNGKDETNKKVVDLIKTCIIPLFGNRDSILNLHFIDKEKVWIRTREIFIEAMLNNEKISFDLVQKVFYWLKASERTMGKYTIEYMTKVMLEQKNKKSEQEEEESNKVIAEPDVKTAKDEIEISEEYNRIEPSENEYKSQKDKEKKYIQKTRETLGIIASVLLTETKEIANIKSDMDYTKRRVDEIQVQLNKSQIKQQQQEEGMHNLVTEKKALQVDNISYLRKISELEKIVDNLNMEIDDREKFTDTVTRNREKLSEEHLNRLASKLKIDYRDYCDAKNLDMTIDLGENMREQLGAVFSILEKNGIKLS